MADQVNAVTADLLAAAKNADQIADDIAAGLATLMGQLDEFMATFKGSAATAFDSVKLSMQQELVDITDALRSVSAGIQGSSHQFEYADSEAEAEISKVLSVLGGAKA